jgi:hypothetical protein
MQIPRLPISIVSQITDALLPLDVKKQAEARLQEWKMLSTGTDRGVGVGGTLGVRDAGGRVSGGRSGGWRMGRRRLGGARGQRPGRGRGSRRVGRR